MATRWRLESPLVAETSPRRLLETSRVSGESREIQTCSIFWRLFQSPAGLGDVSATYRARAMFWSPESPRLISLGSRGDASLVRAQAIFWSPESRELPQLNSRGDVSASEIGPLDPRLPFPYSVGGIFLVQPVYQDFECFSQLAATMNDSFEHVE